MKRTIADVHWSDSAQLSSALLCTNKMSWQIVPAIKVL